MTVTAKDGSWTGILVETRTVECEGQTLESVKVRRTDRKMASWYWMSQVDVAA